MIRYDSHHTPPPETSCRHKAWLASKSGDSHLNVQPTTKSAKDARRRRMELRRIRSLSQAMSNADPLEKLNQMPEEAVEVTSKDLGGGTVRRRSYDKISVVGRRREMEGVVEVKLGFLKRGEESYDFFGMFDGRDQGRMVALARCQMLHQMLAMIVEEETEEKMDWEEVMIEGFDVVEAKMNKNGAAAGTMVAVVGDNEVVVAAAAKCDGSKAVVWRGGEVVRLFEDQKAMSSDESSCMKDEMRVRVSIMRNREDEFLILGSHGFWDVISDEVACRVARRYCSRTDYTSGGAEAAAALLAKLAVAQGSQCNISVIVVDLRRQDIQTS